MKVCFTIPGRPVPKQEKHLTLVKSTSESINHEQDQEDQEDGGLFQLIEDEPEPVPVDRVAKEWNF